MVDNNTPIVVMISTVMVKLGGNDSLSSQISSIINYSIKYMTNSYFNNGSRNRKPYLADNICYNYTTHIQLCIGNIAVIKSLI